MTAAKKKGAKFFALDQILTPDGLIAPGEAFEITEETGLRLVGKGSAETPEMNEARGKANAAVKKARNELRKAEQAEAVAVRHLENPGKAYGKGGNPDKGKA